MKQSRTKKYPLAAYTNIMSGEYFEAFYMGTEDIEGKPFYILRMKTHPRVVKMAVGALRKTKIAQ